MAQKWYRKAPVQAAIIGAVAVIVVGVALGVAPLVLQVQDLKSDNRDLEHKLTERIAEVQRLETLLAPFKTIALERYMGSEAEALENLARQIGELQTLDAEKSKRIAELEEQLEQTSKQATPPTLELLPVTVATSNTELVATLRFKPSKNQPLGTLQFIVELPIDSPARITDFWPTLAGGSYETGEDSKLITEDGHVARLVYSLLGAGYPTMELKLSGPAAVRITGNYIDDSILAEIK